MIESMAFCLEKISSSYSELFLPVFLLLTPHIKYFLSPFKILVKSSLIIFFITFEDLLGYVQASKTGRKAI